MERENHVVTEESYVASWLQH